MSTRSRSARAINLLSLPIAVKLAIGLGAVLLITALVTNQLVSQVVTDAQQQVVLQDLETLSRSNAFRVVDVLGQEIITLNNLATTALIQQQLRLLSQSDAVFPADEETVILPDALLTQEVVAFLQTHREFSTVAIVDEKGIVRAVDPLPFETRLDPDNWRWYEGALLEGTYIHEPDEDFLTGVNGIQLALQIPDTVEPDRALGVVYAVWNMSNVLDVTLVGTSREGTVVELDGSVLISGTEPLGSLLNRRLYERVREAPAGSFRFTDDQGREWLYGFVNMSTLNLGDERIRNLRWIFLTRQPLSAIEANVNLLAGRLRLAVGASALVVTLAVAGFATLLLRPLRRLTDAAAQIRRGNLSAPIPDLPTDEVGQLAGVLRGLVEQLLERVSELRAAVQVSHAAVLTLDLSTMLEDVVRSLTTQFGYPDVRVYLVNPAGNRAVIQAAAGAEGERLLRAGHRVPVDETTLIGRAILLGEPQIGSERERLREAGLMTGRAELAIPLQSGSRPLGVLYLLARRLGAFEAEDVDLLRLIADQVSATIANARLFEQSAANLAEIEALNRRLTRGGWEEYLGEGGVIRHTPDPERRWPALAAGEGGSAAAVQAATYVEPDGRIVLAAPVLLRGEVIGTLAATRPAGARWSRDEVALMESVAARMAMIAESIRLVDESSRRAQREQRVNEVSASLLQRATSVDAVLRGALDELNEVLGSDRIALRLGPAAPDGDRQPGAERDAGDEERRGQGVNGDRE